MRNFIQVKSKEHNCTMDAPKDSTSGSSSSSSSTGTGTGVSSSSSSSSVHSGSTNQDQGHKIRHHGHHGHHKHRPGHVPPGRGVPQRCQWKGAKDFAHCGLFGDPHLRTFDSRFQTCKVRGAWPLVSNDHLNVMVTNDPVEGGQGQATATSKLTVIVKSEEKCGSDRFHTYQAQTDSLPSAFEDGNTVVGKHGSVRVLEVEAGRHVEIHVAYIATTIVVRQIGRYFTFAIHTPQALVSPDRTPARSHRHGYGQTPRGVPQLCSTGCPASERINYQQYLAERRDAVARLQEDSQDAGAVVVTRAEAAIACKDAGLVDFYFDSCVFDLMATGDHNFTLAALAALRDVLRLDPAMAPLTNRTDLAVYDAAYSSASPSPLSASPLSSPSSPSRTLALLAPVLLSCWWTSSLSDLSSSLRTALCFLLTLCWTLRPTPIQVNSGGNRDVRREHSGMGIIGVR